MSRIERGKCSSHVPTLPLSLSLSSQLDSMNQVTEIDREAQRASDSRHGRALRKCTTSHNWEASRNAFVPLDAGASFLHSTICDSTNHLPIKLLEECESGSGFGAFAQSAKLSRLSLLFGQLQCFGKPLKRTKMARISMAALAPTPQL